MPQTSSAQFESALTFNKAECSMLLKGQGLNIAEAYYLAKHEDYEDLREWMEMEEEEVFDASEFDLEEQRSEMTELYKMGKKSKGKEFCV